MPIKIQFVIEADGNDLTMSTQIPTEYLKNPTATESAALDLVVFITKAVKIWRDTQDKTPEQCKAILASHTATRH